MCFPPSTFCFLIMLSLHCQIIQSLYNILFPIQFSSVQLLSCVRHFATPWIAARQASLSITNSWISPRLTSMESVMPSSHLILCCPFLLPPSVFPSIRVFSNESVLHQSVGVSASASSIEYSRLISFRMDWFRTGWSAAAKSLQSCPTLCDPIDSSHQAPLSLGFSRQEHWSGLPFPSPIALTI